MPVRRSFIDLSSELSPEELEALREILRANEFTGLHLEIGTAAGGTLKELLLYYKEPRPPFVVVDPFTYFPNQLAKVRLNLESAGLDPAIVEFRTGTTESLLRPAVLAGERFDFMLIDGHHDAIHVMRDLGWAALLNIGGFVCLHDDSPKFPGVGWAARRFLKNSPNYRRVSKTRTLLVLQKTSPEGGKGVRPFDLLSAFMVKPILKLKRSYLKRFPAR